MDPLWIIYSFAYEVASGCQGAKNCHRNLVDTWVKEAENSKAVSVRRRFRPEDRHDQDWIFYEAIINGAFSFGVLLLYSLFHIIIRVDVPLDTHIR